KLLNDNFHVRMQLKRLERSRNIELMRIKRLIGNDTNEDEGAGKDDTTGSYIRQIEEHFGKPYSYYYHALRKNEKP
ncbi:MAG: hypothetical protein L3J12_06370, partial [Spirochaetales bacterium]|nr:hypothetical protein [Spirochaetales bacterium]